MLKAREWLRGRDLLRAQGRRRERALGATGESVGAAGNWPRGVRRWSLHRRPVLVGNRR